MEQALAVPLVAFFCLIATVAVGLATHGHAGLRLVLPAPPRRLRAIALALLALAVVALLMLVILAQSDYRRAEAQARLLAQDATRLDETLRGAGPDAEPTRITLYRYTDGIARQLYAQRRDFGRPSPETLATLRDELRALVATLPTDPARAAVAGGRLEAMLRTGDDLLRLAPPPGVKWCRPIVVALLMASLGLLALVSPPRARSAILLAALAGVLSLGIFLLEEMASPFSGAFTVSHGIFDEALFVIAN